MVIVQHRLVKNSSIREEGAGSCWQWEPWTAPDENTPMFNYSSDITERHSQPLPFPDKQRILIIPFRRVKVLLKARIIIIESAVSILSGYARKPACKQRVRGIF